MRLIGLDGALAFLCGGWIDVEMENGLNVRVKYIEEFMDSI